ncbi:hypothetical protein BVY01_04580, partial [bacterium I07]
DTPKDELCGFYPSWDPTGERIALSTIFLEGENKYRRIGIYTDLFSSPIRERLHTEEQLKAVFGKGEDYQTLGVGINGVAWSPDGDKIASACTWGLGDNAKMRIVIADANGSGNMIIIPQEHAGNPCWSPGGQYLLFSAVAPGTFIFHIYRVNRDGTGLEDLSINPQSDMVSPAWYG